MTPGKSCFGAIVTALLLFSAGARAEDIAVSNFGTSANAMPWAVALEKGFFKAEGADITGIIASSGGGPDLRILLAGHLPYAETSFSAVVDANQAGADLVVVSTNVNTVADTLWVALPNSPVKSLKDIKGRRIAFTNPGSTTQALAYWIVDNAGLTNNDVKYVQTGSLGAALTALEHQGVDLAPIAEPAFTMNGSKYQLVSSGDNFPPISGTVGATSREVAKTRPELLRGINGAWRKAVEFMQQNPHESAQLIARHYKVGPDVVEKVMVRLMDHGSSDGVPHWGLGNIQYGAIQNLLRVMKLIGAVKGEVNVNAVVDESFLTEDLRSKK